MIARLAAAWALPHGNPTRRPIFSCLRGNRRQGRPARMACAQGSLPMEAANPSVHERQASRRGHRLPCAPPYVSTRAQSASSRPGYIPSSSTAIPLALSTKRNDPLPSSGARSVGSSKYMSLTTRR